MLVKVSFHRCATVAGPKALPFFSGDGPQESSSRHLWTGWKLTFNLSLLLSNNGSSDPSKKLLIYCFQSTRLSWLVDMLYQIRMLLTKLSWKLLLWAPLIALGCPKPMRFGWYSYGNKNTVWAPTFWLPMAESATGVLDFNYSLWRESGFEGDVSEFPSSHLICHFLGIDLSPFKDWLGFKHISN